MKIDFAAMLAYRCGEFLDLLHIPAILKSSLEHKLDRGEVGLGNTFKTVKDERGFSRLISCVPCPAFEDIWVVPNAHLTTRSRLWSELHENENLKRTLLTAARLPVHTNVFELYWSLCGACTLGVEDTLALPMELEWHLEAAELLMIPHADAPNVIVRPLPPVIYERLDPKIFGRGASVVCLVSSVDPGQILKRDFLPRKRTRSRIARLLTLIGDAPERWAHESERAGLQQVNDCSSPITSGSFEVAKPTAEKADARPLAAMTEFTPATRRVFSDYPSVRDHLSDSGFEFVSEFEGSDILFAVNPVASFNALGRRLVNQFPHEAILISPRCLLHAVRSEHHGQGDLSSSSVVIENHIDPKELLPEWFPLSFDLKTEVKLFLEIYDQIKDPWWLLVGGEAGCLDWCVTSKTTTIVKYIDANDGNWVAHKLDSSPLLYRECRMMLSTFLLVYAFEPIDTYLYKQAYGAVAGVPFSLEAEFLGDAAVQLPFVESAETVLSHPDLVKYLASQDIAWEQVQEEIALIVRELLFAIHRQIGPSQRSRALYRLDFHLPSPQKGSRFRPQLSRAVFAPDLSVPSTFHPTFVNEVFDILFSEGDCPDSFIAINDGLVSDSDATDVTSSLQ